MRYIFAATIVKVLLDEVIEALCTVGETKKTWR